MRLNMEMDRNFSFNEINAIVDSVERKLLGQKEELEIATVSTNFRRRRASLNIYFLPEDQARKSTTELYEGIRNSFPDIAGVEFKKFYVRISVGNLSLW